MSFKNKIIAVTPMVCLFFFLLLGFSFKLWHPGWIIFILIPAMPYLVGKKRLKMSIPVIITIIYLILGFGFSLWHPGWIIFILIPVFSILFYGNKSGKRRKIKKEEDDYIEV